MNSEEGLRALESLHERLCVLERAHANRLGVLYPNYEATLQSIYNLAYMPISIYQGELPPEHIETTIARIVKALRDNEERTRPPQFKNRISQMINEMDRDQLHTTEEHNAIKEQMKQVFNKAFLRAFTTLKGG